MSEKEARARGRIDSMSLPPRLDASPEELVQAMFNSPPKEGVSDQEYFCSQCGRQIVFPEVLHEDGTCLDCQG